MTKNTLWLLLTISISGSSQAQNAEDLEIFRTEIDSIFQEGNLPGGQIALVHRDSIIWIGNFGMANKASQKPVSDTTYFRIGSITKSFVAIAALMLQESGQLDLNQTLSEAAPDVVFHNPWEKTHPVRLAHLMEHTTGFDDWHLSEYAINGKDMSLKQAIDFNPKSRSARWPPGTHMQYCNSGPPLVAYVIERSTGEPFEEFVDRRIFRPLGMVHSSFRLTSWLAAHLASGYSATGQEADYWHVGMRPAGSINSNATEMGSFVRMLLNDGILDSVRLVAPFSIDRMETVTTTFAATAAQTEGYGLANYPHTYRGFTFNGHGGGMDGYLAQYGYNRDLGVGYVTLVNGSAFNPSLEIIKKTIEFLTKNRVAEEEPPLDINHWADVPGYYRVANSRIELTQSIQWLLGIVQITEERETLFLKPWFQAASELVPVAQNVFRLTGLGGFSSLITFVQTEDGETIAQITSFPFWNNLIKTSPLMAYLPIIIAGICLLILVSAFLFTLGWMAMWIVQRNSRHSLSHKLAPILCLFPLIVLPFTLQGLDSLSIIFAKLGNLTFQSFMIFLLPVLFTLFSVTSLSFMIRSLITRGSGALTYYVLSVSIAYCIISAYLVSWGIIGIRLWAY